MRRWLIVAGVLVALLGQVGEWRSRLNGDAAYQLDTAARMIDGTRLYVDVVDLNPPFVFWMNVPPAVLARATGLDPAVVLRLMVLAVIGLGGWLTWRVLRESGVPERVRDILLFGFVVTTLGLPLGWFGEREHLLLALIYPYVVLAALQAGGRDVGTKLALGVGVAAGIGVLLKPPAGLVFVALAVLVAVRRRSLRALLVPEVIGAGVVLIAGAVVVLVAAPAYLETVRRYGALYWSFSHRSPAEIMTGTIFPWTVWLALGAAAVRIATLRNQALAAALGLAAAALMAAVLVQGKGFGYHYFPAVGMAVALLLLLVLGGSRERSRAVAVRRVLGVVALSLTVGVFLLPTAVRRALGRTGVIEREARESAALVSMAPKGSSFTMLSSRLADGFPLALETGARLATRLPHLWFVDAAYPEADSTAVTPRMPDTMTGAEQALYRMVGEDLGRQRPELLLIRNPAPGERRAGDLAFDYLRYFCADTAFRVAAAGYRPLASAGGFDAWRRESDGGAEPGNPCAFTEPVRLTASGPSMLRGE